MSSRLAGMLAIGLFLSPAAGADVVVTAHRVSLVSPSLDEAAQNLGRVPGGTSLLNPENLAGKAETLKDAMDMCPGVFVQSRQGSMTSRFSIRGSGIREVFHLRGIRLLQDGVTLGAADGEGDVEELDLAPLAYAEVYRGGNALALGSATLGGAVNFVSQTGLDAPAGRVQGSAGSWGTFGEGVAASFRTERLDGRFSLGNSWREGFQDYSREEDQKLSANLGLQAAPGVESRLFVGVASGRGQLPGAITRSQLLANPRQAEPRHVAGKWRHDFKAIRLSDKTVWKRGDGVLGLTLSYAHKSMEHPVTVFLTQDSDNYGLSGSYDRQDSLAGRESRFLAGVDLLVGKIQDDRFQNLSGTAGARTGRAWLDAGTLAAFAQEQVSLRPGLLLTAGLQVLGSSRAYTDLYSADGDQSAGISYRGFNPKAGLTWEAKPSVQVFANWSRSFEPPSFSELASSNYVDSSSSFYYSRAPFLYLNPQTASTWEMGSRGALPGLEWDLAGYWSTLENELLTYQTAPGANSTANAPSTRHRGVEAGMTAGLAPGLRASLNYLWNDFNFAGDPLWGDNRLPGLPVHSLVSELEFRATSGAYLRPGIEWIPQGYPVDMANRLFTEPYFLVNLKVGWKSISGSSFFVQGSNLTDQVYAATTGIITRQGLAGVSLAQFNPGDGRSFEAGLDWSW